MYPNLNSKWRTLFPPNANPVKSSLLINSSFIFKIFEREGHTCRGVGKLANFILLILDICLSNS